MTKTQKIDRKLVRTFEGCVPTNLVKLLDAMEAYEQAMEAAKLKFKKAKREIKRQTKKLKRERDDFEASRTNTTFCARCEEEISVCSCKW